MSIIEFIQFKQKLYLMLLKDEAVNPEIDAVEDQHLILPDSCPQSMIVSLNETNFKLMARLLFIKYIATDSMWQINISYHQRLKYYNLMENVDKWLNNDEYNDYKRLYLLFDYCILEMISLIKQAFSRFKREDDFLLLQKHELEHKSSNSRSSTNHGLIKKISSLLVL